MTSRGITSTLGQFLSCFAVTDIYLASPAALCRPFQRLPLCGVQEGMAAGQLPAAHHEAARSVSSGQSGRNSAWDEHG